MSSFYDDASLVVIPSGYKTSKIYAEKPTDGSGDLTFTRASGATRVGPDGLIEKVRTNLVLQSQTFDNASWNKTTDGQVTITANAAAAPDGTTTAEKMIPSAISGFHCVAQTITLSAGEVTISVYAKSAENSFLQIFDSLTTDFANFNLTTGVVGSTSDYVASIQSAGNGWFRCTATKVVPSGSFVLRYGVVTTATAVRGESFTGNGTDGLLIWGAQAEQGVATAYIPTTTAAVSVGPVANVPRLDYLGSTCPRLLLEPQRTNLYTYSEQLNQWTASSATVTANYAVSPDGYTNAERVQFAAGGLLYNGGTGSAGENTLSVYAKATNGTSAKFRFFGNGNTTNSSDQTATGQWQRFTFTYTYSALTAGLKVATTGADDILFYGFQHEIGAQATSYIPTLAASATRGADACSKTGISSLIGQTEGTVFVDFTINGLANFGTPISVNDGTTSNYIWFTIFSNGNLRAELYNGAAQASITFNGAVVGSRYKMAFGYKTNDFVLYVNGALAGTDLTGTTFSGTTLSRVDFDLTNPSVYSTASESINKALLFKTRLTNAQMAELTTL